MKQTNTVDGEKGRLPINPDDFDRIVIQHQRQIYRVLLCLVRDADSAETLTQECFLRAFRKLGTFRGESNPTTWLMRIAINLAHDHNKNRRSAFWRKLTHTDRVDLLRVADGHGSAEQVLIRGEAANTVQLAVERLSDRQRTVFLLRFVEDMTLEEIAHVLDLESGTVKAHLHRAVDAVRGFCAKHGFQRSGRYLFSE